MTTDKHFYEFFHLDQFSIVLLNPLSEVIHNHLHTKLKTFFLKKGVSKTKPGGCWCYKLKAVLGWVRHHWHPGVYGDGCYNSCETVDHLFIHCVKWFITLSTHCVNLWSTVPMVFQWFTFLAVLKRLAALQLSCTGPDTVITFVLTYHFSTFLMPIFLIHWPSKSLTARRFTHQSKSSWVLQLSFSLRLLLTEMKYFKTTQVLLQFTWMDCPLMPAGWADLLLSMKNPQISTLTSPLDQMNAPPRNYHLPLRQEDFLWPPPHHHLQSRWRNKSPNCCSPPPLPPRRPPPPPPPSWPASSWCPPWWSWRWSWSSTSWFPSSPP